MNEERTSALGDLRALVTDALATTRGLGEEECRRQSAAEGWPAVIVAYHIGLGLRRQAGFIARALTGEEPFDFEWEPTHAINAVNAREHVSMSKETAAEEIEAGRTVFRARSLGWETRIGRVPSSRSVGAQGLRISCSGVSSCRT